MIIPPRIQDRWKCSGLKSVFPVNLGIAHVRRSTETRIKKKNAEAQDTTRIALLVDSGEELGQNPREGSLAP